LFKAKRRGIMAKAICVFHSEKMELGDDEGEIELKILVMGSVFCNFL
jgi:hypothetical protein